MKNQAQNDGYLRANAQQQDTDVFLHRPDEGYDKITLKAGLCVLGAWAILLIIGA